LFNEFLLSKSRAGRSDNYTGLLLKELRSFCTGRERRVVASITAQEIEQWLYANEWSARTRKGRLMTLRNVFSRAVTRGTLARNVALGIDMPTDDQAGGPTGSLGSHNFHPRRAGSEFLFCASGPKRFIQDQYCRAIAAGTLGGNSRSAAGAGAVPGPV
jgi:hypothetical protein